MVYSNSTAKSPTVSAVWFRADDAQWGFRSSAKTTLMRAVRLNQNGKLN